MDIKACIFICALLSLLLNQSWGQVWGRYRNPYIQYQRYRNCRTIRCGNRQICDLRTICPFVPPCERTNGCVSTLGLPRPGTCPSPNVVTRGQPYNIECYGDGGCNGQEICCHSYINSYCYDPGLITIG